MLQSSGPETANWTLQDRGIRHAHYLTRLRSGEANRVLDELERDVYSEIRAFIREQVGDLQRLGGAGGPVGARFLQQIDRGINAILSDGFNAASERLEGALSQISTYEANWQVRMIRGVVPGQVGVAMPNQAAMQALATAEMQGRTLREWFVDLRTDLGSRISRTIKAEIANGSTNRQLTRALLDPATGPLAISARSARKIVKTAVGHATDQARQLTFEENRDLFQFVRWISILDPKTCPICAGLDGEVFAVEDFPTQPQHFHCRCTSTGVLKDADGLEIDLGDAPPGTEEALGGEIPEALTYPQWLENQSAAVQNEALGPTRAHLFRTGQLDIKEFSEDGRVLTLAEVADREGLDLADILRGN